MIYEEFDPSPALRPWIANYWRFEVEARDPDAFEHVIVPDGTLSISFMLTTNGPISPALFAGPSRQAHRVPVQRGVSYFGLRLQPAATGPLLKLDATVVRDRIGLLASVAPEIAEQLDSLVQKNAEGAAYLSVLEQAVQQLVLKASSPDAAIVTAVGQLLSTHGSASVSRIAAQVGLSARQFRRKFLSHVGLSPKEFGRLRRIRHACILMLAKQEAELAGLSHDGGYADQPHLTREFRGIFGSSPRLVEAYLRRIEHIDVRD